MSWFEKRVDSLGSVLYSSAYPPPLPAIRELAGPDMKVEERPAGPDVRWVLRLEHPELGVATVLSRKDYPLPPPEVVSSDHHLSDSERTAIGRAGSALGITVEGRRGHLLRDRKLALRIMQRLLGAEGLAAVDHCAMRFWTRADLDDELAHDADLDIQSLYTVHCVTAGDFLRAPPGQRGGDGAPVVWLHTHGLAELGSVDFDVLRPSPDLMGRFADLVRAIAFSLVEGEGSRGTLTVIPGKPFALVSASDFDAGAAPEDVTLRADSEGGHRDGRVVLCEPARRSLFRKPRPVPSQFLSGELPDDALVQFSNAASSLMAERARKTYGVLRRSFAELKVLGLPVLAKIGYVIDGGGDTDLEHLWFEVHDLGESELDATLVNAPFNIARMKEGERGRHELSRMTDWAVMTPAGQATPRSMFLLRWIHDHFDDLRKAMAEGAQDGG